MTGNTTVFVVDDDPAVRDSLRFLLEANGYRVECYDDARSMIDRARQPVEGCLVADLRLPGMSGLDMHDQLQEMSFNLPTIMISGHGDVPVAVRALKSGVIDFLEKPFSEQALLDRIGRAIEAGFAQRDASREIALLRERYDKLSPREREVMDGVVGGRLNKQIASDLGLSHKTIEVHRSHVMEKMKAGSLAELVRMAVALGLASVAGASAEPRQT